MSFPAVKVARGSLIIIVGDVSKIPVSILTLAYIARTLTGVDLGIVFAFNILLALMQVLSNPGLSNALTTFVAEGIGKQRNIRPLIRKVILIGMGIASVASIGLLVFLTILSSVLFKNTLSIEILQVFSLDVFLACLGPYMDGSLQGLKAFKSWKLAGATSYYAGQTTVIALVAFGLGIKGVLLGWVLSDIAYLSQTVFSILRNSGPYSTQAIFTPSNRELISFSLPVYGSSLIDYFLKWFDQLFVLSSFPIDRLAVYNVANSIFGVAYALPLSVSEILLPHFSEVYGRMGRTRLEMECRDATRYTALLFTPLFLGLAVVSNQTVSLIAGGGYGDAAIVLSALCVFGGITISSQGFDRVFLVLKKTKLPLLANIAAAASGVAFGLLSSSFLGILGIATARGVTFLVIYVIEFYFLRKTLSLKLDLTSLSRIVICSVLMAAVIWVAQLAFGFVEFLWIYVAIGVGSYLFLIRQMRVPRKRDFEVAREFLGPKSNTVMNFLERLVGPKSS